MRFFGDMVVRATCMSKMWLPTLLIAWFGAYLVKGVSNKLLLQRYDAPAGVILVSQFFSVFCICLVLQAVRVLSSSADAERNRLSFSSMFWTAPTLYWMILPFVLTNVFSHVISQRALSLLPLYMLKLTRCLEPLFTTFLAAIFLKDKFDARVIASLILVTVGVGMTSVDQIDGDWFGIILGCVSTAGFAASRVFAKKVLNIRLATHHRRRQSRLKEVDRTLELSALKTRLGSGGEQDESETASLISPIGADDTIGRSNLRKHHDEKGDDGKIELNPEGSFASGKDHGLESDESNESNDLLQTNLCGGKKSSIVEEVQESDDSYRVQMDSVSFSLHTNLIIFLLFLFAMLAEEGISRNFMLPPAGTHALLLANGICDSVVAVVGFYLLELYDATTVAIIVIVRSFTVIVGVMWIFHNPVTPMRGVGIFLTFCGLFFFHHARNRIVCDTA